MDIISQNFANGDQVGCSDIPNLPTIDLNLSNHWIQIAPQDYVGQDSDGSCYIDIYSTNGDTVILGNRVFRNYYLSFDV